MIGNHSIRQFERTVVERDERASAADNIGDTGKLVVVAGSRLLFVLQLTPLLGIAGAVVLSRSSGASSDFAFALGVLLMLGALALFQQLRARLIARLERRGRLRGMCAARARESAVHEVDRLFAASSHGQSELQNRQSRLPPISFS